MTVSVGRAEIDLGINQAGFNRELNAVSRSPMLGRIAGIVAGAFATYGIVAFGQQSIKLASDLMEVQNVVDITFGNMAQDINNFAKDALHSFGLSELSAKRFTSTMGAMLKSSGIATEALVEMSKGLAGLSGDFASFYNLTTEEAFSKIRAGLTGEVEPLRRLGINMSVANLEAHALAIGLTESFQAMSAAEQTMLRYNYLLHVSSDAQGDFARTSRSWANQTRLLNEQWNIFKATIGAAFINIFTHALGAINSFVQSLQVAANAFRDFTAYIFGGTNQVVSGTGAAAKSTASLSGNIVGLGKDTKKANKEITKSLLGFDELNLLAKAAGENVEEAGQGLAGITPAAAFTIPTPAPEAKQARELNKFFERLKETVGPITQDLFAGLKWAYDNVLLPLGKWAKNEALPAFLNLVAGALKVLNPLIDSFKPLAGWLWDNFLQPIAGWTGGVIVSVLNNLAVVLERIGKWMSDNQPIVNAFTNTVVLFFAAWKLITLMAFIQMSGGIVKAFSSIKKAIHGATIAKIINKAETMYLIALYAKDFVVSVGKSVGALVKKTLAMRLNTAAITANKIKLGLLTLATKVWAGIVSIAKIVTLAFGLALKFLLSPVGLVIMAIAGLVAGIILLVRNWDKVKEVAGNVWREITRIWGVAVAWFRQNVVFPIERMFIGFINRVIEGINNLVRGLNRIKIDVPDWVPVIGGKKFGFNIREIQRLNMPANVVSANAPSLAMLNRQDRARVTPAADTGLTELANTIKTQGNTNTGDIVSMLRELLTATREGKVLTVDRSVLARVTGEGLAGNFRAAGQSTIPF